MTVPTDTYIPPLATHTSPSESVMYYRADTFGGAARGNLFVGFYKNGLLRMELSEDGRLVVG